MKKARWDSSGLFRAAPQAEDFSFLTNRFFAALLCVTQEKSAQSGAKKLCLGALVFLCGAAKMGKAFYVMVATQNPCRGRCRALPSRMQSQNCTHHRQKRKTFCRGGRPCPPMGNGSFATTLRPIGCASCGSMRRPQASFEAQPRAARLLAPKMGIDPYKWNAYLHRCIRFCGCIPPGGQRRPPLRGHTISHWCIQICSIAPPLRYGERFILPYYLARLVLLSGR